MGTLRVQYGLVAVHPREFVQVTGRGASWRHYHAERGNEIKWDFHTASMVKLLDETRMVIDLIVSPDKPITVEEWKEYFSNIQHSSEEKFGIPPMICEGTQPCRYRRLTGSYVPDKEDSGFFPLARVGWTEPV